METAIKINCRFLDDGISSTTSTIKWEHHEHRTKFSGEGFSWENVIFVSAKKKTNIEQLINHLFAIVENGAVKNDVVVSNARHFEALTKTHESLIKVLEGLDVNITGDFLAMDIRQALHHLGEITGEIVTDDLLDNIFSKFCIGK